MNSGLSTEPSSTATPGRCCLGAGLLLNRIRGPQRRPPGSELHPCKGCWSATSRSVPAMIPIGITIPDHLWQYKYNDRNHDTEKDHDGRRRRTERAAARQPPRAIWQRPIQFNGTGDALFEQHLTFDNVADVHRSRLRQQYEALARSMRDILSQRWRLTQQTYDRENPKRIYYLSLEFLIGRSLANNILNLRLDPVAQSHRRRQEARRDGHSRGGTRRRPRQWRPRPPRGVLPRFDGNDAAPGDGLWAALRVRHFPPDHRERLAT